MDKCANFNVSLELIEESGAVAEYKHPLLSWIRLIFTDDQPNANKMGISKDQFSQLLTSMQYMPIKADFDEELGGHEGSEAIGVIKEGEIQDNKIVAVGALWKDEKNDVVSFFKKSMDEGHPVNFSWEVYYKDSSKEDGIEWLRDVTAKAITAVKNPAYQGRTPLLSFSSLDLLKAVKEELKARGEA